MDRRRPRPHHAHRGGHHRISDAEIDRLTAQSQPAGKARAARPADPDDTLAGLSARNRLSGFVEEVRIDGLLAQVRLRVGNQTLTAVVTSDAIHALKLKRGDDALAVIKSTEVMIAKSLNPNGRRRSASHEDSVQNGCCP